MSKRQICNNCGRRIAVQGRASCRKCLASFRDSKRRARQRAGLTCHPKRGRPRITED